VCSNVPDDRLIDVLHAGWRLDRNIRNGETAVSSFDVEDIRKLNHSLGQVGLTDMAVPLSHLVHRLRNAGLPFSDRRAVKMQRLIAASALLCGRTCAVLSDLWVFRHVWDTLEQQEVLNALVQEALRQATPDAQDHPRASGNLPDAEELARDLAEIDQKMKDPQTPIPQRAMLKDRLTLLGSRVQWVADENQRQFLQTQIDALWKHFPGGHG
jgi:MoxR-like ATPase